MENQISTSENYAMKAWHCAAVLLSIGRPVSPAELAGKCEFFRISPEDVEFLCLVPNSPIFLTENDLVLLSTTAFRSVGDFFTISVPKVKIGVFRETTSFCSGRVVKKYFRRRKKFVKGKKEVIRSIEGNELKEENVGSNLTVLSLDALPLGMPWGVALRNLCDNAITPLMEFSIPWLLEHGSKKDEDERSESKLKASQIDDIHNSGTMTVLDTAEAQVESCRPIFFDSLAEIAAFLEVDEHDPMDLTVKMDTGAPSCTDLNQHDKNTSLEAAVAFHPHEDQVPEKMIEDMVEQPLNDYSFHEQRTEKEEHSFDSRGVGSFLEDTIKSPTVTQPTLQEDITINKESGQKSIKCPTVVQPTFQEDIAITKESDQAPSCTDLDQHDKNTSLKATVAFHPHEDQIPETRIEDMVEQPLNDYSFHEQRAEKEQHSFGSHEVGSVLEDTIKISTVTQPTLQEEITINKESGQKSIKSRTVIPPTLQEDIAVDKESDQALVPAKQESGFQMTLLKNADVLNNAPQLEPTLKQEAPPKSPQNNKMDSFQKDTIKSPTVTQPTLQEGITINKESGQKSIKSPTVIQPTFQENIAINKESDQALVPAKQESAFQTTLVKNADVLNNAPQLEPMLKQESPPKSPQNNIVDTFQKDRRAQKDQNVIALRDNSKQTVRNNAAVQEKCADKSLKDQQKVKFPEFESYTVVEEEGSGGYGTVYRARRKTDGVTFAIKCPHAKAHIHHLKNELKMLQRFGGKNFVIKYEDSLKSGNAECFVLEHVEHDRPEALRREIDIYQLQWYGYCLFKALSSLHKQGVFHRDVKPGNFLFSCKTSKGYLCDFNLAKDIHKQPGSFDQSQPGYMGATEHVPPPQHRLASPSKRRKILKGKPSETLKTGVTSGTNHNLMSKTLKRKAYGDFGRRNLVTSQGGEGSGLTSKDLTSTRNSGERLREPVPCQGRKELINLAQEAMKTPNIGTGCGPLSKRKRIAASPVLMDRRFIYLTPTPLHSSGNCISGAGSLKNKGVKPPKEGPCVGTKGFRAPEVLLRSSYQDPRIDVWSAGVTLLYLITGKMPFGGDPEQNMKDIVRMKGNEELWEVAKLHNRESSFPEELLDIRFLQSTTIKEWCVTNTKRVKFLDTVPASLFDLIEKCLTVNPRMRITAEEAFKHEFFASCHNALHSIKLRRLSQNHPSKSNSLPLLREPVGTPYKQQV